MQLSKTIYRQKFLCTILLSLFFFNQARATHIRAGDICSELISQTNLTYRFTITIYTDLGSPVRVGQGNPIVRFGDGTVIEGEVALQREAESFTRTTINDEVGKVVMVFVHTYQAPRTYVVSYTEQNRNADIINIPNSVEVPFHIQTVIRIEPGLDINRSPKLTFPPIDRACIGKAYFHNPGAYDEDGDSLVFKIVLPQFAPGQNVNDYTGLDDPTITNQREDGTGPALLQIDKETGLLTWDAPQFIGEYNIAFIVEEWRFSELTEEWELQGFITRDMQILVEDDCTNNRPELSPPMDICVEAGTLIEEAIEALDPDGDPILLEASGGPFELTNSPALLDPEGNFLPSPQTYQFRWQTNLSHVRERPYQVQFKVSDNPPEDAGPTLSGFETWNITVVAPAPTGLNAALADNSSIQLSWNTYPAADLAPVMQVWRRIDSFNFTPGDCVTGIPDGAGYELIDELPIGQTMFLDNNEVKAGTNYCYRLVTRFPLPGGGESYASEEFCVSVPIDVPLITNVSVERTDQANGEILVRWTPPLEIDQTFFPPPYEYELIRYEGLSGTSDGQVVTTTQDTSFTDTNLNTLEVPYHYQVNLYSTNAPSDLIDTSEPASSVRLEAIAVTDGIALDWVAIVPWTNQTEIAPYHYIYRNRTDVNAEDADRFVLIDSVNVKNSPFQYTDSGTFNGIDLFEEREYCYFVVTSGSYGNPLVNAPLLNNSQKNCAIPGDEVAPIKPDLIVDTGADTLIIDQNPVILVEAAGCADVFNTPCSYDNYFNTIQWEGNAVDNDVAGYRVYFSADGMSNSFVLIGETIDTEFRHSGLSSFKGCYRITTIDRSGNESEASQTICFDNCPYYRLPNTFTPNADNRNDTFRAFDRPDAECPRFVKEVEFQVFNRWGGDELYSYTTCDQTEPDLLINWDGKDKNGIDLASGTYYYRVVVTFDVLDPSIRTQEFRNWVKIIR